jgi:hypothetical protein
MTASRPWNSSAAAVAALMVVMLLLIVPRGLSLAMYGDEIRTWRDSVQKTYIEILTWRHSTDHPPLSYLIIKATVDLFRSDAGWVMRLPSMLCGLLCVPIAYRLGRAVRGSTLGLILAACAAVDLNLVWQSQQARMYSMLMLVALLAQLMMVRILRRGRAFDGVALGFLVGLGAWLHFSSLALWAGVVALPIVQRSSLRPALIAMATAGAITLPALLKLGAMQDRQAITSEYRPGVLSQMRVLNKELDGGKVPSVIVPVCAVAGLVLLLRRNQAVGVVWIAIAGVTIADTLIAARYRPVYGARYVTVMEPILWSGLGWLAIELWDRAAALHYPRVIRGVTATLLAGYLIVQLTRSAAPLGLSGTHEQANHFARAVAFVKEHRQSGDQIQYVPEAPLSLYGKYYRLPSKVESPIAGHPMWIVALVPHPSDPRQQADRDARIVLPKIGKDFGTTLHVIPPRDRAEMEPTRVQIYRIDQTGVTVWSSTGEILASDSKGG